MTVASLALALTQVPTAPRPAPADGARLLPVVVVLLAVVVFTLWLGRRALRSVGVSRRSRESTAAEREEAFMAMTLALHEAALKRSGRQTGRTDIENDAPSPAAPPPAFEGRVHCAACGGALGAAGPMLRFVTKCPGCGRRVIARAEGLRVTVDVDVEPES